MTDEHALLFGCLLAPHDAAPRLVYADWLEERGRDAEARSWREPRAVPKQRKGRLGRFLCGMGGHQWGFSRYQLDDGTVFEWRDCSACGKVEYPYPYPGLLRLRPFSRVPPIGDFAHGHRTAALRKMTENIEAIWREYSRHSPDAPRG